MVMVQVDQSSSYGRHAGSTSYLPDVSDSKIDDDDAATACTQTSNLSNTSGISLYTYKLPDGTVTTSSTVPILQEGERVTIRRTRPSTSGKKKNKSSNSSSSSLSLGDNNGSSHHSRTSVTLVPIAEDRNTWKESTLATNPEEVIFNYDGSFVGTQSLPSTSTNNNNSNTLLPEVIAEPFVGGATQKKTVKSLINNKTKKTAKVSSSKAAATGTDYDQYDVDQCLKLEGDFDDRYDRMVHRNNSNGPKNVFIDTTKSNTATQQQQQQHQYQSNILDGPVPLRTIGNSIFSRSAAGGGLRRSWFSNSQHKRVSTVDTTVNDIPVVMAAPGTAGSGSNKKTGGGGYRDVPADKRGYSDDYPEPEEDYLQEVSLDGTGEVSTSKSFSSRGNGNNNNNNNNDTHYSDIEYHSDVLSRHRSQRRFRYCTSLMNGCMSFICCTGDDNTNRRRSMKRMIFIFLMISALVGVVSIGAITFANKHKKGSSTMYMDYTNGGKGYVPDASLEAIFPTVYIDAGHYNYNDQYKPGRTWLSDDDFIDKSDPGNAYYGCDLFDLIKMNLFKPTCSNVTYGNATIAEAEDKLDVSKWANCTNETATLSSVENTRDANGDVWDPELFCNERWFDHKGLFEIPVHSQPATYSLKLYFNELFFSRIGERVFDIHVEDTLIKNNFDILKATKGEQYTVVYIQTYHVVTDGMLTVQLTPNSTANDTRAKVNAIVVQMVDDKPTSIDPDKNGFVGFIDHPNFLLKAQSNKGPTNDTTAEKLSNDSQNDDETPEDDFVMSLDDNYREEIEDGTVDNDRDADGDGEPDPSLSPTRTEYPTFWVPDEVEVEKSPLDDPIAAYGKDLVAENYRPGLQGSGDPDYSTPPGGYNLIEENSIHIDVGMGKPFQRSSKSRLMWFDDEQFITSAQKGNVIDNCGDDDYQKPIEGMEQYFPLDMLIGCHERVFDNMGIYEIPLPVNIEHTVQFNVTLFFTESFFTGIDERVFNVYIEDEIVQSNLDIYKETGGQFKLYTINKIVTITDGLLDIELVSYKKEAKINAIHVRPYYQSYQP